MTRQQTSYLYAALAILAWSSVSTAFKIALRQLTPIGLLVISSATASVLLCIYKALSRSKPRLSRWENFKLSLCPALLNPFLYYLILFEAYSRLRAQEAQALNYTWAIVLSVFSVILLKERFRLKDMIALVISFCGVIVISTKGRVWDLHFDDAFGTALAAGSSIIWALYWIINMRDKRNTIDKLSGNFFLGFVFVSVLAIIGRMQLMHPEGRLLPALLAGIYVGIFEMGLTFVLWMKALQTSENTAKVANLIFITPFLSLLFIRFALSESIHVATIIGLCLIIASNLLQKLELRRK
ncbi:MAG TPA: DMT family transporter [Candidatus Cloacimonadota bacterium]|jgi:drug/metabolite transporter (DMT)-like permease|nr:DMT family transporter [Candidatus Cloacimonadota bacterium]MDD4805389.1 DMT family transporter [Candidatus Cloacimonadota bacterium]HOH60826.1 DMT family transporter [Candidatus Cloacimonadota bacterium]